MTSLKRIELIRCCLQHRILNELVSNIPHLEMLHIHNHWVDASGSQPEFLHIDQIPDLTVTPPLTEFSYHNNDGSGPPTHAFVGWIGGLRTLKTLRIHITARRSLHGVGCLLHDLGRTLEHLELQLMSDVSPWSWDDGTGDDGTA